MPLHVEVSRPFWLLAVLIGVGVFMSVSLQDTSLNANLIAESPEVDTEAVGGSDPKTLEILAAEDEIRKARIEQELINRQEEVLRYQLNKLEKERMRMGSDLSEAQNEEFRKSLKLLVELINGRRNAESRMRNSFQALWDAKRHSVVLSTIGDDNPVISLSWPLNPLYGISALFGDQDYERIFGLEHEAIDIPALQGTVITAAQDGTVEQVVDSGMGYSYVVLRHNGYATVYGHILEFLVEEGDVVYQGDPIARSGGMPGTPGAGHLTTGPHLHFEVVTGLGNVDPLDFLPIDGVQLWFEG